MKTNSTCIALFFSMLASYAAAQTVTLSTGLNPVSAATVTCGTLNVPIYGFSYNSTTFSNPVFTGITNWQTSGTYTATDVLNFKLYQTNFSVFNTTNLLATVSTSLGPGAHSFPAFSYTISPSPVTRYFWITTDLSSSATNNATIICNIVTAAMTTITGTENFGTNNAGGTQTISCSVLPVELLSFTGSTSERGNMIEWVTASETNNSFFTLERSADATEFTPVGTVQGAGNTATGMHYSLEDKSAPKNEASYYRLKQTDYNGDWHYAGGVIAVSANNDGPLLYSIDQENKMLTVWDLHHSTPYTITSITGEVLASGTLDVYDTRVSFSGLQPGLYIISFRTAEHLLAGKFIIMQ
jgi:hypothetical protein